MCLDTQESPEFLILVTIRFHIARCLSQIFNFVKASYGESDMDAFRSLDRSFQMRREIVAVGCG